MFSLLWDIMHYAIGSLFIGLLLTVALVGLLFFIIKGFYTKKAFSPLSIVAGLVLGFILSFQIVPLYGAVALKWKCHDIKDWLDENLIHPEQFIEPQMVSLEESEAIVEELVERYPIVGSFVGGGQFEGFDTSNISQVMVDTLDDFLNPFIYKALGWALFFTAVTAVVVVWTMRPRRNTYISDLTFDSNFSSPCGPDDFQGTSF